MAEADPQGSDSEDIDKMGHVQSKRKKEKQIKRDISDYIVNSITHGDPENYKMSAQMKINRLSADLERLSVGSSYYSRDSVTVPDSWRQSKISKLSDDTEYSECKVKNSYSFQKLNVDNDPVLTKLQNEQNVRLEKMEERMSQIRLHAMQEADRRKFAHLFKAKSYEGPTTELLNKVKNKLPKDHCDNEHLANVKATNMEVDDDKGEIIPVTVVTQNTDEKTENNVTETEVKKSDSYLQTLPALGAVNMNDPKSILLLPFLFPVFILILLVRSLSHSEPWQGTGHSRHKKRE